MFVNLSLAAFLSVGHWTGFFAPRPSVSLSLKWEPAQVCGRVEAGRKGMVEISIYGVEGGGVRISTCWSKPWPPSRPGAAACFTAQGTEAPVGMGPMARR